MSRLSLTAAWVIENKERFPWRALLGASIHTDDEIELYVCKVTDRAWPPGPILEVRFINGPPRHNGNYTIHGFTSGKLLSVSPADVCADELRSVFDETERLRNERLQAEIARAHAEEAVRKEAADAAARAREAARQEAELLDASRKFDLVLFDLDETLLQSGELDEFRGRNNINKHSEAYLASLRKEARGIRKLITEDCLSRIRGAFPSLKLGIFTRAPRNYALTLLEECYPGIIWDCIVAFEDVGNTKPAPDGVDRAARSVGISDMSRVAVVGDDKLDMIAAYQAGAYAVLYHKGWGSQWKSPENGQRGSHYRALEMVPDAILDEAERLSEVIKNPMGFVPALEASDANSGHLRRPLNTRVDERKHFNNLDDAGSPNWVEVHILGRYFAHSSAGYDYSRRLEQHGLSRAILAAKEGVPYPDPWVDCCARYIEQLAQKHIRSFGPLVVCTVPPSTRSLGNLGSERLKDFLGRIQQQIGNDELVMVESDVLKFSGEVPPNKILNKDARLLKARDSLRVARAPVVEGRRVLVLDDVVTSGATLFYADRYLKAAGAIQVHCLALAQTVSSNNDYRTE